MKYLDDPTLLQAQEQTFRSDVVGGIHHSNREPRILH